jgi:predicted RNA-binding protein (virulence factor B family)
VAQLGQYNHLEVVKRVDFGAYLDGGEEFGEVLLPERYVPQGLEAGQLITVFLYTDSEDRVIATTEKPIATVGEFAFLKVVSESPFGVFLDWGLSKDVLLPIREQRRYLKVGESCLVRLFLHTKSNRVAATQKFDKFLEKTSRDFRSSEEVDVIIIGETELGYSAIVNGTHLGLFFESNVFEPLREGDARKAYIKQVREDGKIDLSLTQAGYEKVDSISKEILIKLKAEGGFLAVTDKTPPDVIYYMLKMSKKNFKKAIGALYKQRRITIEENGIRLL